MQTSRRIEEALLTLAWSMWTELGVAGVERRHQDCAVDPEALLLFTPALAERDRRLRDESLDCALAMAPYLFVTRLKSLLKTATPAALARFAPMAATFNDLTTTYVRLPQTTPAEAWQLRPSGKSERGAFARPSQIVLRSRSIFGVAARAEVVTAMVCTPQVGWTAAQLATHTGMAKRVVAGVLEDFERGGILRSAAVGNRRRYDIVVQRHLEVLAGPKPARAPAWSSILPFVAEVLWLVEGANGRSETSLLVDAQALVGRFFAAQAQRGHIGSAPPFEAWPEVAQWLADEVDLLASGRSGWLDEPNKTTRTRRGPS